MPAALFVIIGAIAGYEYGQVIEQPQQSDKLQALKLIRPFIRGHHENVACDEDCGKKFASSTHLLAHRTSRHPEPIPKPKSAPIAIQPKPTPTGQEAKNAAK